MIASQRNQYILRRLKETGIVEYKSIASELGVSEATVRRDFEKLEQSGKLQRVQGGAVSNDERTAAELSIPEKHVARAGVKFAVAQAAAAEVRDGECVFLDMGTSIAPLGKILLSKQIHIITSNNLILRSVTPESRAEVHVVGGRFSSEEQMFFGPQAEIMLSNCAFHRAFIGCMGLNPVRDAVYVTDTHTLTLKQIAMKRSGEAVLLTDRSKLSTVGLFRLCGLRDFDRIYIDGDEEASDGHLIVVPVPEEENSALPEVIPS